MNSTKLSSAKIAFLLAVLLLACRPCSAADTQVNAGFDGPTGADTFWWPNDPNAATGPNHVMVIINGIYRIYAKTGTLVGSGGIDSLFNSLTPGVATLDPNITYDDIAGRFVLEANGSGSDITNAYVAVSNTSDPTQGFTEVHKIGFPGAYDGSKIGFNADVYVICATTGTAVIDKSTMLDTNNATFTITSRTTSTYGRAARMHGALTGAPLYFTSASGGQIRVTRMDNVLSASPTFTGYNVAGSSGCSDPATPAWRNNSLVTANTGAMYWWQVDTSTTTPALVQQGYQTPQAGFTTGYGSANIAPNGDMGMTWMEYSASTNLLPVNTWVAWRAAADPTNSMRKPIMARSSGSVIQANGRHGDFSSTVCDINTNGTTLNTFWVCNGYIRSPGGEAVWNQSFGGTPLMPSGVTIQPASATVTAGNPVTLSVTAAGAQPFNYQWLRNGTNISGATTNPLSIAVTAPADGGNYTVVVTNNEGSATSAVAVVTIVPAFDGVWINSAGGSWNNTANWSGGVVGTGPGKTANFGTLNITANSTVTLDGARSIGQLIFGDTTPSHNWTLNTGSGGPLTLDVLSGTPTITVSNQTATIGAVITGIDGLLKLGTGTLALSLQNTYTGDTTLSAGTLDLTGGGGSSGTIRGAVTVNTGSTLRFSSGDVTGYNGDSTCLTAINIPGGTLNVNTAVNQTLGNCVLNLTGGSITGNSGGNVDFFKGASALNTLASATPSSISGVPLSPLRQGNTTFTVAAGTTSGGIDLDISSVLRISPSGDAAGAALIKAGPGVMRLLATNTFVRATLVNAGTLLMGTNGSLASTNVTVASGATLAGTGLIKGAVTNLAGSILSPGFGGIGTLTISNTLLLQGSVLAEINRTAGTADKVQGISTLTCGGTLSVSNLAGTLAANDTFTLFGATAYLGTFAGISLPALGSGLAWDASSLLVNGSIKVVNFTGVNPATNTPTGVTATPASTSQINLSWIATPEATSYVVSRGGTPIATVMGTNFVDSGRAMGVTYCYTVAGVNSGGSSTASASTCGTTMVSGATLSWDANAGTGGLQDGSGNWGATGIAWQYGGNNVAWNDGNTASIGINTTTNCTVTLTNNVAPTAITFNTTGGGTYTLAGTNSILLTNNVTITANRNGTISAYLNGPGTLVSTGAVGATLTVSSQNNYSGGTVVNGGRLTGTGGGWYTTRSIGSGGLTVSNGATAQFTQAHGFGYGNGGYGVTINNGTLQFDHENYVSGLDMTGGSVTGAGEIRTTGATYNFNGAATNSLISCGLNMVSAATFNVADGPSAVDLLLSGYISNAGALTKSGAGVMRYTGTQTGTSPLTITAGNLLVDGVLNSSAVTIMGTTTLAQREFVTVVTMTGGTLSGTGTINGPVTQQAYATLAPGGISNIGTLTINNTISLNGNVFFRISKNGGVITNDQVKGMTGEIYTDTSLILTNITTDGTPLAQGDTFQLFARASGSFVGEVLYFDLPAMPANLVWDVSTIEVDGALRVAGLPVVTNQPQSLAVNSGAPATFTVTAIGSPTLAYQWLKNGISLSGATNTSYAIPSATTNDAAGYSVVVENDFGSTTSAVATLTVNLAPAIPAPPQSLATYVNSNAAFTVTASGTPAPAYQWRLNGTNLAGASASSYDIPSAQPAHEGNYTVVVTNVAGALTSSPATLTLYREFGSAPAPYPSLLSSNGARHLIVPGYRLGATNVASTDARTNSIGNDGVIFLTTLKPGQASSVQVVATGSGYLNGWIDYGTNGSWADPTDRVFTNVALVTGTNVLTLNVPATAVASSNVWARFRFSTAANLSYTGEALDGEVEDYQLAILSGAPPSITGSSMSLTGGFSLSGIGLASQSYVLMGASNLAPPIYWTSIVTNAADSQGLFNLTDPQATNRPQSFYRVMAR